MVNMNPLEMFSGLMTASSGRSGQSIFSTSNLRRLLVIAIILTIISILVFNQETISIKALGKSYYGWRNPQAVAQGPRFRQQLDNHPITTLIEEARVRHESFLTQRSHEVKDAAERYRESRGRHPPPGFDAWFDYAQEHDAIVVESFFDRIYDDMRPYWSLAPDDLRRRAHPSQWEAVISVRNRTATLKNEGNDPMSWMKHWLALLEELAPNLPDVDIPLNTMDEPRIIVPWAEVNEMIRLEADSRKVATEVVGEYAELPPLDAPLAEGVEAFDPQWIREDSPHCWNVIVQGCAPDSPAAGSTAIDIFHEAPIMPTGWPEGSHQGFVANWTVATNPCQHPHLRTLHGSFIEPISWKTSQHLVPVFGGSKLPMNNDILLPPAMYLDTGELYGGGKSLGPHWKKKKDGMIWRGAATGGRHKFDTWTHFHRHRFLQMINATAVQLAEAGDLQLGSNLTFTIPDHEKYPLMTTNGSLTSWLPTLDLDGGFDHMRCFPQNPVEHLCEYTDHYFKLGNRIPMAKQYGYKYLPDIDGNSFSGRFRAFLKSTSLPIKGSVYREWHDSRLTPWVHFVPVDNTFVDLYGVLDYLMADERETSRENFQNKHNYEGHEEPIVEAMSKGERIAMEGKEWADKVLRREDMLLYTWRLMLEWARVRDDRRDHLGWIKDLF